MSYGLDGFFDRVQIARVAAPRTGAHRPAYLPPFDRVKLHRNLQRRGRRARGESARRYFNAPGLQGYDDEAQLEGLFSFIGKAIKGIGKGIFGAVKGVGKGIGFVGKTVGKGLYGVGKGIYQVGKFAVPLAAGAVLGFNPFGGGQQQQQVGPGGGPIYFPYPTGPTGGGQMPGYPPYFPGPSPTVFGGPTQAQAPQPIFFPSDGGGGGGGGGGGTPLFTTPQGAQVYAGAPPSDGMSNALPLVLAGVAAALLLSRR